MAQQTYPAQQMYQPNVQPVPGQNTIVIGSTQRIIYQSNVRRYEHYKGGMARGLGITQIVIGVLAIVFQIIAITVGNGAAAVAPGIWCGIFVS